MFRKHWLISVLLIVVGVAGCGDDKEENPAGPGEDGTQQTLTVDLPGGATMEFVWIEPGTFTMGTTAAQEQLLRGKGLWHYWFENEHPAHPVTISEGFYLGGMRLPRSSGKV